MNEEITANLNYEWAKTEITKELQTEANSFIRVGWIFKMVRDGKIETPYGSVTEFAEKEWNLGKDVVSRYMRINDHFSTNGYSEKIAPQYGSFGYSKLAIMLTLPDEINEELSPEYSKSDIQAIKEDYDAEQKITPIEVMAEPTAEVPETQTDKFIALVVKQINDEHPEPINDFHFNVRPLAEQMGITDHWEPDIKECYMPDDDYVYNIRISGKGRYMVTMKDPMIVITNLRTLEKTQHGWDEFTQAVIEDESRREFSKPVDSKDTSKKVEKPKHVIKSTAKTDKKPEKPSEEAPKMEEKEQKTEDPDNDSTISSTTSIEKVEGEVIDAGQCTDNAPQNIPYPDGEEPEITHVSSEDPLYKENDEAAGDSSEAAGDSSEAAGDKEDMLIQQLNDLLCGSSSIRTRTASNEIKDLHHRGYREHLDTISGWIADVNNTTGRLYAILAGRGQ